MLVVLVGTCVLLVLRGISAVLSVLAKKVNLSGLFTRPNTHEVGALLQTSHFHG